VIDPDKPLAISAFEFLVAGTCHHKGFHYCEGHGDDQTSRTTRVWGRTGISKQVAILLFGPQSSRAEVVGIPFRASIQNRRADHGQGPVRTSASSNDKTGAEPLNAGRIDITHRVWSAFRLAPTRAARQEAGEEVISSQAKIADQERMDHAVIAKLQRDRWECRAVSTGKRLMTPAAGGGCSARR